MSKKINGIKELKALHGLQKTIVDELNKFLCDNDINTTKLRETKVHGVAGATIYKIIHFNYIPSNFTIRKLLDGFGYSYEFGFGCIENVKKADDNDN